MKAIICHEYGALNKLRLEEVDAPQAADSQLLLKVLAAGINFPDGLLVQGLYQAKPETPFIPIVISNPCIIFHKKFLSDIFTRCVTQ